MQTKSIVLIGADPYPTFDFDADPGPDPATILHMLKFLLLLFTAIPVCIVLSVLLAS